MSSTNLTVVNAITQFINGTQAAWNAINVPIPTGLLVYATDTTAVKMGNGTSLYVNLPVLFTLSSIVALAQTQTTTTQSITAIDAAIAAIDVELGTLTNSVTTLSNTVAQIAPPGAPVIVTAGGPVSILNNVVFYGINNATPQVTTLLLPTTPVVNEHHIIKDLTGVAAQYNITIAGNGNTIDTGTNSVITTAFGSLEVWWDGAMWATVENPQKPNLTAYAGNPNGAIAGQAAGASSATSPPDMVWDSVHACLWICVTSGIASVAAWTVFSITEFTTPVSVLGTAVTGTITLDRSAAVVQQLTIGGAMTLALTGWLPGGYSELVLELTNGGSATVTMPAGVNWITSTGATTTSFATYGVTLQTSGVDWIVFFSPDGTTVFGKVIR